MTGALSNQLINRELSRYGAVASQAQCDSIRSYVEVLLRWNRKVSLTTVTDIAEILRFHIGESVFAISAGLISEGRLADVGSGAGLPGIPLALFSDKLEITLIEANAKKASFLAEVTRALCLSNLRVIRQRFEEIELPEFDFIAARALGQYERLLEWSSKKLAESGCVVLWLGLKDAQNIARSAEWFWESPREIPGAQSRVILVGRRQISEIGR